MEAEGKVVARTRFCHIEGHPTDLDPKQANTSGLMFAPDHAPQSPARGMDGGWVIA
ncbi:hypothetical protein FHR90_001159 [Endobacter medicaginis]|uniref:Uncharacterized protein n=1 Tax=Endobacter medicaginis TaxID=1181271 RepID=A0A839UU85_9PROT|nr:hypothetical protein [Endobacter medicaginis]